MIKFLTALEKKLISLNQPVVSDYAIFLHAYNLDRDGHYNNIPLHKQKQSISREKGLRLLRELQDHHIIKADRDFKSGIFRVNEVADATAEEVCAIADPFCYISHLSAMTRYGFTHRLPAHLSLTTPSRPQWSSQRDALVERDYGAGCDKRKIIPLQQVTFRESIRGRVVDLQETKFPAKTQNIKGSRARISSIGDTFVDMMSHPVLCGGMTHVMEVWQEHAPTYLEEIIAAVERCTVKIVKVRAGYTLDEYLNIKDSRIESWLSAAQRGGSRVLDPEKPFVSTFSPKWMISLNV